MPRCLVITALWLCASTAESQIPFYYGENYGDHYVKDWNHDYWYDYGPRYKHYFGDPGAEYYPRRRDPGVSRRALQRYDYLDHDYDYDSDPDVTDRDFDLYDGDFGEDGLAGYYSRFEGYGYADDGFGRLSPGTYGPRPYGRIDLDEGYETGLDEFEPQDLVRPRAYRPYLNARRRPDYDNYK